MKLFTSLVCGTVLLFVAAVPASAASTSVTVKGNGTKSKNTVGVKVTQKSSVAQTNFTHTLNEASVVGNSGGITVKNNTGNGTNTVTTGNVSATVTVTNYSGSNTASVTPCPCDPGSLDIVIKENGSESQNQVQTEFKNTNTVSQSNMTMTVNGVMVSGNSGDITVKDNTGSDGETSILPGAVTTTVAITNYSGSNTL